jgi:hypothetical protein
MLLRICLVLAILAGLGVIGLSQFVLKPQIQQIVDARNDYHKKFDDTTRTLTKTKKDLSDTQAKLKTTESTLEETRAQLTAANAKANSEQNRANGLQTQLTKAKSDLKTAEDELFRWRAVAQGPEQVRELVNNVKTLTTANEALKEENTLFKDKIKRQELRIAELTGGAEEVILPRDVKGKVVVVDPKWDFVVLDIGSKNNVAQNGLLLVSRNGALVAKLRVANVDENRSVANVLPGWKLGDIVEGDMVVSY